MPSTVISRFNYDPVSGSLRIRFVSGWVYEYKDVPKTIYIRMKEARSKGIFFNREIKDQYPFEKIFGE